MFDGKPGTNTGFKNFRLDLDEADFIIVADSANGRIILLEAELNFIKVLIPKEETSCEGRSYELGTIFAVLYDKTLNQIFVSELSQNLEVSFKIF